MRLSQLVAGFSITPPGADPDITGVTENSRRIEPGMLFVAVPGTALDGHAYIGDAVTRGAAAIVAERTGAIPAGVPVVRVPSSRDALALLASRYFGTTSSPVSLIGFTGTFGKTSTSDILRQLLDAAGQRTGVLGSLGARYKDFYDPGEGLTTPAPVELHRALRGLADAGATTVILEVTSHALRLGRVNGLRFDGGLLAAVMPGEHTDFHRSYEDYVEAKRLFLDRLNPVAPLAFDADNLAARRLVTESSSPRPATGFTLEGRDCDVQFYDILLDGKGATFSLGGRALATQSGTRLHSPLLGRGHLRNVALALTYAIGIGLPGVGGEGSRRLADAAQAQNGTVRRPRTHDPRRYGGTPRQSEGHLRSGCAAAAPRDGCRLRSPRPPRTRHQQTERGIAGRSLSSSRRRAAHRDVVFGSRRSHGHGDRRGGRRHPPGARRARPPVRVARRAR